jgi:hypothetical protein
MDYCYSKYAKGKFVNLKPIQKLIPYRYLLLKCLLSKKQHFLLIIKNELRIFSEDGLLKQLDLFKSMNNKFIFIKLKQYNDKYFVTTNDSIHKLILYLKIKELKKDSYIIEQLLNETPSIYIRNTLYYLHVREYSLNSVKKMKSKTKYSKTMNYKEEIEWKLKVFFENSLDKEFYKQYKIDEEDARNIINKVENSKGFKSYYNKTKSKFKPYSFTSEIKEIKKSIFYTCKVATKYKKLFPNY